MDDSTSAPEPAPASMSAAAEASEIQQQPNHVCWIETWAGIGDNPGLFEPL